MKIRVTMKDPDTLNDAIEDAVTKEVAALAVYTDEADAVIDKRCDAVRKLAAKWFNYSEYLTVEIDTEAKTIVVCENGQ